MRLQLALVAWACLASARGGPINSLSDNDGSKCATKCAAPNKFRFRPGTTYHYDYVAQTSTSVDDASQDTARLTIIATAAVRVITPCDMTLQLRDVTIQESDPDSQSMRSAPDSARAAALLERQPLRFSYQDGVVDELCPSHDDELWALNVKRGVLSAFQNSMSHLESGETVPETDVSGRCVSEYHVLSSGFSTTVRRTRDLTSCSDRHHGLTALVATPYGTQNPAQSLPLLKSSHECEQTVNQDGVLSSATCTERHLFRPFSREASGAVTKVSQSLKYKKQSRSGGDVQDVTRRTSLVYEHSDQGEVSQKAQKDVEGVLRQLCSDTATDIRPDTPRLFSSLVSAMRKVDTSGLKAVRTMVEQKALCSDNVRTRKFFMDALPMASTEPTVTMMTEMLTNNDVTGVEADMWLTSLALIQEPEEEMLQQVMPLLRTPSTRPKAMLPVSSMVNNFCRRQQNCSQKAAVQGIMGTLEEVVGSSCFVNNKNREQVLLALRAIGNAGHMSSTAILLNRCVTRSRNPMEIRVSAAQAFRRLPCDADRDAMMETFKDRQQDSEIRIAAYLAAMTCPDEIILQKVQQVLRSETDQQVGSFVWSHLSNLRETSSPHKQAVRRLLKKVKLPAKFDLGRLQFSRYYEGSAFLKRLNSGAAAESSLVWSSASSLPRSASANLTVDLFGRSLNLLDVGVRMEGLEYLLETLLGPYGYFGDKGSTGKDGNKFDQLKGSLYLRLLGNEMTFQQFQGVKSLNSAASFNMLDFLIKLSQDHDVNFTNSVEFLDTEMTVATSCGLPLSLAVRGSATVDLRARGKMDMRKVASSPRSLLIDGEIKPSGAVRVSGQMSVDAMVSRAALRVTGTLHTSSALKGRVALERGRVLSVQLDMPEDKMDIFHVSSEFSIVHNTVEKNQPMITENRRSVKFCTGDALSRITGVELCGELQYPNASTRDSGPYFPMTGPVSLGVTLHKRDSHSGYRMMAKTVQNKKSTTAQLSFNTPGSKVNRALAFDLAIDHKDKQLEVSAASPWKKAEFKGAITATNKLLGVSGSFVTDDVNTYAVTTEVKIDESKKGVTYVPLVEIRRPGKGNVALTGKVAMETTKSATADLTLSGLTARPLSLKTGLTNTNKEMCVEGSVANGDQVYSIRVGTLMKLPSGSKTTKLQVSPFLLVKNPRRDLVAVNGSVLYNEGNFLKADVTASVLNYKPASVSISATRTARKSGSRYRGHATVKSSLVSGKMDTLVSVKRGRLVSGKTTLTYNVPRVARDKVVLLAKLSDRSSGNYRKYSVKTSLDSKRYPDFNTAFTLNMDHKRKVSSGLLEVKYGRDPRDKAKRVLLTATVTRKIKNALNVYLSYKMQALAPQKDVDIQVKGKHSHTRQMLDSMVALNYGKGKDLSATLTLKDESDKLKKMAGSLSVQALEAGLTVRSDLVQAANRQWQHKMSVETNGGSKHSISTVYQQSKDLTHDLSTVLSVRGFKPLTLSGKANLEMENLHLGGSAKYGKEVYAVSGAQKLAGFRYGKWNAEVTVPSRRIEVKASAGEIKGNLEAFMEAAWDADKDDKAKVTFKAVASAKTAKSSRSHEVKVSATTPVAGWERVAATVGVVISNQQCEISTVLVMGGAKKALTSDVVVALPLTPRHVHVTFKATTPFRGYKSLGLTFYHKMDSAALSTKVTTSRQKDNAEIRFTALNRSSNQSRDLEAQFTVTSSFRATSLRSFSVAAAHKDNGRRYDNSLDAKLNGQVYSYVMNMDHASGSNSGSATLTWPGEQSKTTWSHRYTATDLTSTMTSIWGDNKRVQIDVTGAHVTGSLSGEVNVQTPWAKARDWHVTVDNQYGPGKLMSSSSVKIGHRDVFTHNFNGAVGYDGADHDFVMTSAWTQPISSKLNAVYAKFPMSAKAELSWEPHRKVTAEGSVTLKSWDDLDLTLTVSTPVRGMRTLVAQASSKAEGSEVVGQITVDLGMRKNVVMTTRVQRDVSEARVKVTTPWNAMQVMDTGYEVTSGKVKADFKAAPLVLRHSAVAAWKLEDDFSARLRVDTPRDDLPYIQILATSNERRDVRVSRVELEYSPSQIFSVDAAYSFATPLVLDVSLATPLAGYESLTASLRHDRRNTAVDASAQLTYFNDQSVKATGTLDWSRGLDSSLTVNTPFAGWEQSSAMLRYEGDVTDFNSVADVTVGGQSVAGRVKFINKINTEVQVSVTTPWAGWEKMEASMTRKGDLTNLRATATLLYGDHKMEANVLNKINSRKAQLEASVTSPFTHDLTLHVQQVGGRKADVILSYGEHYGVKASGEATYTPHDASARGSIEYRLGGPRHLLDASLAKTGSLQDMALVASASLDAQEVSLTADLNTLTDIKAAVAVRTPFTGFETIGASFHNSGDLSGMKTEANVQYMTDRNINGKMELDTRGVRQLNFRGTLTSPLSGLERTVLSVSHVLSSEKCLGSINVDTTIAGLGSMDASYSRTGPWRNLKGEAHVFYNTRTLLDASLSHRVTATRLQSALRVLTSALPELGVELSHQGSSTDFTTTAKASAGGDTVSSETTWLLGQDSAKFSQHFSSSRLHGVDHNASLVLSKSGPLSDVTLQVTGNADDLEIQITGKLATQGGVFGSVEAKSPFHGYRYLGAEFTKTGDLRNMSVLASVTKENSKVEVIGKLDVADHTAASLDIRTPFTGYSQMGASFNLSTNSVMALANLEKEKVEVVAMLDKADELTASVRVSTPFPGFTHLAVQTVYGQGPRDVSITAKANVEDKEATAAIKLNQYGHTMTGSADLSTPFQGYRKMGSSFTLTSNSTDLTLIADGYVQKDKAGVTVKFNGGRETTASVEVTTPFKAYRQMAASFQNRGDINDLNLQLAANLLNDRLEAVAAFSTKDALTGSVRVTTPFPGFRQVGGSFHHSGRGHNFRTDGQITYMDGKEITGEVSFAHLGLRHVDTSAELRTPFPGWQLSTLTYKHEGKRDRLQSTAVLEIGPGYTHTADLKVDLTDGQDVQLTLKTPYPGFRTIELTHSLSKSETRVQWNGKFTYGQDQSVSSQLTWNSLNEQFTSRFDLQTPFTSDLTAAFDFEGDWSWASTKQSFMYSNNVQFNQELLWAYNDSPLWRLDWSESHTYHDVSRSTSLSLRRDGPWNDVSLVGKATLDSEEVAVEVGFKEDQGRLEGKVELNTPFEGYRDLEASFRHNGDMTSFFNTQAKLEYSDEQEVAAMLDFQSTTWQRLEMTAQLTMPFEGWSRTRAEYRHSGESGGFISYAGLEYHDNQHVSGDLRVTSSPNTDVTLTVNTPYTGWERLSASAGYHDGGWAKKEVSSKLDLGSGHAYAFSSALALPSDDSATSFSAQLTTPHPGWRTLETRLSHEGGAMDFRSSAYLNVPFLDTVSASASLRYDSPFDLSAAAALDTPFIYLEGLKMEVVNGESGIEKTSHVLLGWSGGQEVVMDGTWRHDNTQYERRLHADISLTSPFEAVRSTNWVFEHQARKNQYEQKVTGVLNGDELVDLDLSTKSGNLPGTTLTLRQPRTMLYSLSRTSDGAEVTLDWDRDDPHSNLRLMSRFTDSSDDVNTQHDIELKATHPVHTLGGRYNLHSTPSTLASQGELYWGKGDNRLLSYALDLSDLSRRAITSYEGKVKVGVLSRAVQLSGAVSRSLSSRLMDATLQWDADRDQSKQVGVRTKWTSGDKNTADVILSLPAINQEVRVQSAVSVNQGRMLLDATTALSYCQDPSKAVTLTSTLTNNSDLLRSGSNYSLHLALTHPATDLDMAFTSHLAASPDHRYTAAVDSWYMTSRRERKNMALRGEIDQLRRQISMEMVSPVKKVSVVGEVKSLEPYSVSLTNRYDQDRVMQADVTVDTENKAFSLKTNYDLDHPERTLVVKAYYLNDTAIRASVYRDHVTDVITDALVALRLNTSTVLHSRLHWRSASVDELQDYANVKLDHYTSRTKSSARILSQAMRDELAARYSRTTNALVHDLSPFVQHVDREMAALGHQVRQLQKSVHRAYRRSPYLQRMGTAVTEHIQTLQQYLVRLSHRYQHKVDAVRQLVRQAVDAMTRYPLGHKYQEVVSHLLQSLEELIDGGSAHLKKSVSALDTYLLAAHQQGVHMSDQLTEAVHGIITHPGVQYIKDGVDLSSYVNTAVSKLSSVRMPEEYRAALYRALSRIQRAVSDVMDMAAMKQVTRASNELYQQGVWAYNYWQEDENLQQQLDNLSNLLKEIIQEELEIYTRHFLFLQRSNVTVWDPEHGEVQAELHLPVAMKTLHSVPDVTPLVEQYNDAMDTMIPDAATVQYYYDHLVSMKNWWTNSTRSDEEQLMADLKEFSPAHPARRLNKVKNKRQRFAAAI